MLTGGCLCGGVRFEVDGTLGTIIYCHCSMCRRASGSAFIAAASVRAEDFRVVTGQELLAEYESSPRNYRVFCSRCGSQIFGRSDVFPIIRVRLGALDGDPGGRCAAHIMVGSKAPWFEITDPVEQFDSLPTSPSYFLPG